MAVFMMIFVVKGTSGNLLWKWGAEKIPAGEAINAKLSGVIVGALATKTAGILSSSSPHQVFGGALKCLG
ncbi:MAG: hypothetical protein ACI8XO_002813 [Verrucomicrobiales bacterium]|jgi:hypothetical protein